MTQMSCSLQNEVHSQNNDDGITRTTKVTGFNICEDRKKKTNVSDKIYNNKLNIY